MHAEGIVQGMPGQGMLPACLAAWRPVSTNTDIRPMPDAWRLGEVSIPSRPGATMPASSGSPPPSGALLKQTPPPPVPGCTPALCPRKSLALAPDTPGLRWAEFQLQWLLVRWPWERY